MRNLINITLNFLLVNVSEDFSTKMTPIQVFCFVIFFRISDPTEMPGKNGAVGGASVMSGSKK